MKEKKTKRLEIKLTAEEYFKIKEKAETAKTSMSEFVRRAALRRKVMYEEDLYKEELRNIAYQIRKVGVNLNQLVVLAHQGQVVQPEQVEILKKALNNLIDNIAERTYRKRIEAVKRMKEMKNDTNEREL